MMHIENRLEFREEMENFESFKYFWNCRSKFLAFRLHCNVSVRIVPAITCVVIWAVVL